MAGITNPEMESADVIDNLEEHNADVVHEPLFPDESVTEAELKGEEDTTAEETADAGPTGDETTEETQTAEAKTEENADKTATTEEETAETDKKTEDKKDDETTEKKEDEPTPQLDGLKVALHQEREATKSLKLEKQQLESHNARLVAHIQSLAAPKDKDQFRDFKVLTPEEFSKLNEDDPNAANTYLYEKQMYMEHKAAEERQQAATQHAQSVMQNLVNEGAQEVEAILPGIYQGQSEEAAKLVDFAEENGVSGEFVDLITDPRVMLVKPDGQQIVIGRSAAQVVKFIKSAREKVSSLPDESALREKIEAELTPKLKADAEAAVMEKLKSDPKSEFRSLDQVTSSASREVDTTPADLTEAQWAKLSPEERERRLGAP